MLNRRTVKDVVELEGFGVHTGKFSRVRLHPAVNNGGRIVFVRNGKEIPADFRNVIDFRRATTIGLNGERVRTVEHLLSALYGLGITDLDVEVEGEEIPILDGSSKEFVEAINSVGIAEIDKPARFLKVVKPFKYEGENGSYVKVEPIDTEGLIILCSISYEHPGLRWQEFNMVFSRESYEKEIAPARTFCFYEEIAHLLKSGMGRGGNYKNVVVIGKKGIINGEPRFMDEPVRHKILDFIGDMALSGAFILGKVEIHKNNHKLHVEFIKALRESDAYQVL